MVLLVGGVYILQILPASPSVASPRTRQASREAIPPPLEPQIPLTPPPSVKTLPPPVPPVNSEAKYLAYLPHGGFHSQRIALSNAAVLARLLNRVLVVPPVWLGRVPPWSPFDTLRNALEQTDKRQLSHCMEYAEQGAVQREVPGECREYFGYTQLGWGWFVDLAAMVGEGGWVDRWDFSGDYLTRSMPDGLGSVAESVYEIAESGTYQYKIYGALDDESLLGNYSQRLDLVALEDLEDQVLHFGSLAGTKRLSLQDSYQAGIRNAVVKAMGVNQKALTTISNDISKLVRGVRGQYISVDARVSGGFRDRAGRNMRQAWWSLGREMGLMDEVLADLEKTVWSTSASWRGEVLRKRGAAGYDPDDEHEVGDDMGLEPYPPPPLLGSTPDLVHLPVRFSGAKKGRRKSAQSLNSLSCPGKPHDSAALVPFNTPIYISTDAMTPSTHPALQIWYQTFPCVFTMESKGLEGHLKGLHKLVNPLDGDAFGDRLRPILDGMIGMGADGVVETRGSASSSWIVEGWK